MKGKLKIASGLALPLDVVTRATSILGQRGTGKTSTGVVLVEEASRAGAQVCVVDPTGAWYGLRSSADGDGPGLPVVVFGGFHADVPLEPQHGPLIADLVINEGYQPVLDLEKMSKTDQIRFVAEFCEALYHGNSEPVLLVIDETHRFAPQSLVTAEKGGFAPRCLGAVVDIVSLGRRKGLGIVSISQRLAKLHNDVLEQSEIIIAHRLMGPADRKAISGWLAEADAAAAELAKSALDELRTLPNGDALVYAPNVSTGPVYGRFTIRPKSTFDSSATPEVGGKSKREPRARAEVDMAALEERLGDAIEKAKERDPRELQRQLREARGELGTTKARLAALEDEVAHANADLELARAELDQRPGETVLLTDLDREVLRSSVADLRDALEPFAAFSRDDRAADPTAAPAPARAAVPAAVAKPTPPPPIPRPAPAASNGTANGDVKLKAGARRMLAALAWMHPAPLTRTQVGMLADISPRSGTFSDYLSTLRTQDLIAESGESLMLTHTGERMVAAELGRGAPTTEELVALWAKKLKAGARRMLDVVVAAYPDGVTRTELGERAGISTASGTFSDYLSTLRSNKLIVDGDGFVRASETLFMSARP